MQAWIRSTLIFTVALVAFGPISWAEDTPVPVSGAGQVSQAGAKSAPQVAFPTITMPGQPVESAVFDDEEAPDAVPEELAAPVEAASTGGPKSQTDKIVEKFMELDTDESKSVSVQEYLIMVQQRVEARFAAMDANADGEVSEDEYRIFWKSRMAKWYRLKR